jgi:hypothetical protein
MLRLEIPSQVLEDAVQLAKKRKTDSEIGHVANEVARLLEQDNAVTFSKSSFLQLIYSKIEEARLSIYSIDNENFHGQNAAIFEQARTFRVLFTHPTKNEELRTLVQDELRKVMLNFQTLKTYEMDSISCLVSEMAFRPFC